MKVTKETTGKKIAFIQEQLKEPLLERSSTIGSYIKTINARLKVEFGSGVTPNLILPMIHAARGTTARTMVRVKKEKPVEHEVVTPGDAISNGMATLEALAKAVGATPGDIIDGPVTPNESEAEEGGLL
jgi:hypothetical protein